MMRQQSQEMEDTKKENKELKQKIKGIIHQQPPDGRMSVKTLDQSLPGYGELYTFVITYSFPAGSLNGVSYEAKEFTEYLPAVGYFKNMLTKAFNAGLLFKIQIIKSNRGEIIWNDEIPHKTNKYGGPENNGYPDDGHSKKLREALMAKLKLAGIRL
uniref:E3 ubiquitin-protein ligase DTX3L-like isoform X2 n=1 Tax=Styela clava TaxID=7725 RepID=UPI00193A37D3|nr:E3 ubiquitin-protein ligase DTX3L-like isoform X2 [Styela clava]